MRTALAHRLVLFLACVAHGALAIPARAASAALWVNGLSGEFKRADLSLNKTGLFRQVPQGTICPWFPLPAGKSTFEVTGSANLNLTGDWEFPENTRVLFITHGKDKAASRTVVLPALPKPGFQVFNGVPDAMIQAGDKAGPAARPGFSLTIPPDGKAHLQFANGARWSIGMTAAARDAKDSAMILVLHQAKCDGAHDVMVSLVDSISGKSDEWMLGADGGREPKDISQGGFGALFTPAPDQPPPPFDPTAIDWTKVKSQIAWFNATPSNQSLSIGGMQVFRQLRAGSLAHFAPWPHGHYDGASQSNPGGQIGKASFSLDEAQRVVLVSISQINQPPRLVPVGAAGKPDDGTSTSRKKTSNIVRIMNGLPSGQLVLPARFDGAKLDSGSISPVVEVGAASAATGFPGRLLLATAAGKDLGIHPKSPDFVTRPGDWVLIVFLNASNPDALDYAWVDFAHGTLLTREDFSAKRAEE